MHNALRSYGRSVAAAAGSLFLLCATALPIAAQTPEPLSADRPGFGTGTAIVPRFQAESGYTYSDFDVFTTQSVGQLLLRFPLLPSVELRLALNSYVVADFDAFPEADLDVDGFEDIAVGFKANLARGAETFDLFRPTASLLVKTTLPTGTDGFGAETLQPTALLALGWALPGDFGLGGDINVSSFDAGDERSTQIAGGTTLSYAFGPVLGGFVELYDFAPLNGGGNRGYFDTGLTFLLTPSLQLDVNGGIGLTDAAEDYFVGFGAAYRW